jgi:hypothetical protein
MATSLCSMGSFLLVLSPFRTTLRHRLIGGAAFPQKCMQRFHCRRQFGPGGFEPT